jgi:hypothetical protein
MEFTEDALAELKAAIAADPHTLPDWFNALSKDHRAEYFHALYMDNCEPQPAKEQKLEWRIAMAEEWNMMEPESRQLFEAGDNVQEVEEIIRALYAKHPDDWEAIDMYREAMQGYANVRFGMLTDETAPDHGVSRKVMAGLFEGYRKHFNEA